MRGTDLSFSNCPNFQEIGSPAGFMAEQGALMEFIRGAVTEGAANTMTETEIAAPTSRSEKLAMLIWQVQFTQDDPDVEDGQSNAVVTKLYDRTIGTATAHRGIDNPAVIAEVEKIIHAGGVQGSLTEYYRDKLMPGYIASFQPPVLYTKESMFLAILGGGNANAKGARVRVGYTLERVPIDLFIAALVE